MNIMRPRRSQQKSKNRQQGFSLVELMVVISLSSLVIVFMVQILFSQYVSSLAESTRLRLRTEGQAVLINLQDELLFTIAYGEELEDRLSDSNAPASGWSYDTSPQTLIINEIALDSNRRDQTRNIVRQRINNCETSSVTSNPLAINNIIYYLDENDADDFYTLRKRTVVPSYDLCSKDVDGNPCTPNGSSCRGLARATTCPPESASSSCGRDATLSENVTDMQITYYQEGNIVTDIPSSADKIEVKLSLAKIVSGREVSVDVNHTIRKIN